MTTYLQLAKYSQQGSAGVFKDRLVSRRKFLEEYVKGLSGRILDMQAIAESEWDFFAIIGMNDFPAAKQAAHNFLTYGAGGIERSQLFSLATFEEADAARTSIPGYRPPGS